MAEAIVGPLLSKLQQVAVTEGKALAGVGNEINRLRDKLMWLHALVHETDLRSRNDGNQLVRVLACQMREVAFEAEDAIDSFFLEADLGHDWCRAAAKFFLNLGTQIRVRCILSGKIKSLNARLEDIIDNSAKYSINGPSAATITWRASDAILPDRQNGAVIDLEKNKIEQATLEDEDGKPIRNEEEKKLIELLLDENGSLAIYVVGESGMGKRYLVKKAFETRTIEGNFEVRMWVRFPPDSTNITDEIKKKLEHECSKLQHSGKNLDQVKYLVVVDCPMSSTMLERIIVQEWPKGIQGSKIVLTATSRPRAESNVDNTIELRYLRKEKSRVLFNRILGLKGRRPTNYRKSMMDKVRDHIEEITNGLPLAVVLLARLMKTININRWWVASYYIRNNHQVDQLKTIVSMCIDDLPDNLKSCLLYMAGFPARSMMDPDQLVRLWMAEGFLAQQHGDGVEPKELGRGYLNEFIFRGLVQVVKEKEKAVALALHDRLHELFRCEALHTGFMETHYGGSAPLPDSARRLALSTKKLPDENMVLTKLRTVLSQGQDQWRTQHWDEQVQSPRVSCRYLPCPVTSWCGAVEYCRRPSPSPQQSSISQYATAHHGDDDYAQGSRPDFQKGFRQLLKHSTFLRVINLEGVDIGEKLPSQIGSLLHLQHLGVRCWTLKKVPGSIGNLRKLQTMDVRGTQVRKLPKSFWEIKALCHVLGEHNLEFPDSAGHLRMPNDTVLVLATTTTEPEQSMGESENAEPGESMMPPHAARHLETVSLLPTTATKTELSMGEAVKTESEESLMPPQAIIDASIGLAIVNKDQVQAEEDTPWKSSRTRKPPERFSP